MKMAPFCCAVFLFISLFGICEGVDTKNEQIEHHLQLFERLKTRLQEDGGNWRNDPATLVRLIEDDELDLTTELKNVYTNQSLRDDELAMDQLDWDMDVAESREIFESKLIKWIEKMTNFFEINGQKIVEHLKKLENEQQIVVGTFRGTLAELLAEQREDLAEMDPATANLRQLFVTTKELLGLIANQMDDGVPKANGGNADKIEEGSAMQNGIIPHNRARRSARKADKNGGPIRADGSMSANSIALEGKQGKTKQVVEAKGPKGDKFGGENEAEKGTRASAKKGTVLRDALAGRHLLLPSELFQLVVQLWQPQMALDGTEEQQAKTKRGPPTAQRLGHQRRKRSNSRDRRLRRASEFCGCLFASAVIGILLWLFSSGVALLLGGWFVQPILAASLAWWGFAYCYRNFVLFRQMLYHGDNYAIRIERFIRHKLRND